MLSNYVLSIFLWCFVFLFSFNLCVSIADASIIVTVFGTNISPHVQSRLEAYVSRVASTSSPEYKCFSMRTGIHDSNKVSETWHDFLLASGHQDIAKSVEQMEQSSMFPKELQDSTEAALVASNMCMGASLCFSFGNSSISKQYISDTDLGHAGPEGFVYTIVPSSSGKIISVDGNPTNPARGVTSRFNANWGATTGSYYVLELVGFGFFHPLQPIIPNTFKSLDVTKPVIRSPYWDIRSWHYHTEHPLELQEVLNGFNSSRPDKNYFNSWESMLPQVDYFFEWLVANGQNRLEFLPLWAESWGTYAVSTKRQQRFQTITSMAHAYGIAVGADVPIAEEQQHGWYMTNANGTLQDQQKQIAQHIDWMYNAGFDYLASESGFSEFTHPVDTTMLAWMNYTAAYASDTYGWQTYIKCHCSTDQLCTHYNDPRTGKPLNFNFLPMYADHRMGIMPHTVQLYAYDDPAPTYGNENYTYMFDFLFWELEQNLNQQKSPIPTPREIIYHGETGYWVNYDIDVPLFLPLYGERRLADLRYIAQTENKMGGQIDGQNNFDSGWEWGYWLSNVVTARAAFDPLMTKATTQEDAIRLALEPIFANIMRDQSSAQIMATVMTNIIAEQRSWLIFGNHTCKDEVFDCSGIAYLSGQDTWSTLDAWVNPPPSSGTQPHRIPLKNVYTRTIPSQAPNYSTLMSLLKGMEEALTKHFYLLASYIPLVSDAPTARAMYDSLLDSANITALRSSQLVALYSAVDPTNTPSRTSAFLENAYDITMTAMDIVSRRESMYNVPVERIAGWRKNPTVYGYGYVWTVHSLYYWWRDYALAKYISIPPAQPDLLKESPCYLNIINPLDTAIGNEFINKLAADLREKYGNTTGWDALVDCVAQPTYEMKFPQDL